MFVVTQDIETCRDAVVLDRIVLYGTALVTFLLTFIWIGFVLGLPLTPAHLPAAGAATILLALLDHRTPFRSRVLGIGIVSLSMIAALGAAVTLYDSTEDGMGYHQVSTVMLANGWNPVWRQHSVAWWNDAFPELTWLSARIPTNGLWTDHYPLAGWLLGAAAHSTLGSVDSSKWPSLFFAILAATALCRALYLYGIPFWFSGAMGVTAAFSPVVFAQMSSTHNDGMLGSELLLIVATMLAWHRTGRGTDLLVICVSIAVAMNIKFTGAVYAFFWCQFCGD